MNKPIIEIYEFRHEEVKIGVKIDYVKERISLVDTISRDAHEKGYEDFKFLFANRELEYMNGWRRIMEGMQLAVDDAEKKLVAYRKKFGKKEKQFVNILFPFGAV